MASEYERLRAKNIADNKRILAELGLQNPYLPQPRVIKKTSVFKRKRPSSPVLVNKRSKTESTDLQIYGSVRGQRRRSSRIKGKPAPEAGDPDDSVNSSTYEDDDDDAPRTPRVTPNRPNFYGAVQDISVGTMWQTRLQCCMDGVHRPTVAGIHMGADGAYSLALSGGYEDDIDLGECFTYTGEGGRNLKGTKANPKNLRTAPQSKDQTLTRGNLALSRSVETGNFVRVIRGYKLHSPFAPEEGYRYDGLYKVEKFWFTIGMSGFGVYKFALKRIANQPPPPWTLYEEGLGSPKAVEKKQKNGLENGDIRGSQDSGLGSETHSETDSDHGEESKEKMEKDDDAGLEVKGREDEEKEEATDDQTIPDDETEPQDVNNNLLKEEEAMKNQAPSEDEAEPKDDVSQPSKIEDAINQSSEGNSKFESLVTKDAKKEKTQEEVVEEDGASSEEQ